MSYKEFHDSTISIRRSFLSALIAMGCTLICYLLFALFIYLGFLKESVISPTVFVVTCLCAFLAGFLNAVRAKQCGWANGACAGGAYMLLYYLLSIIGSGQLSFCLNMAAMMLLGILTAIIGGILGINFKANRKCRRGK